MRQRINVLTANLQGGGTVNNDGSYATSSSHSFSSAISSKDARRSIFNARCSKEIAQFLEKNGKKTRNGLFVSFPSSALLEHTNEEGTVISKEGHKQPLGGRAATASSDSGTATLAKGYRFTISMNASYFREVYRYYLFQREMAGTPMSAAFNNEERFFSIRDNMFAEASSGARYSDFQQKSAATADFQYPWWINQLDVAEFWVDIYDAYPFESPLIQCTAFPRILNGLQFTQCSPLSFTFKVLKEEWTPSITLSDVFDRLTNFITEECFVFFERMHEFYPIHAFATHLDASLRINTKQCGVTYTPKDISLKRSPSLLSKLFKIFDSNYGKPYAYILLLLILLFLRIAVGQGSYSGEAEAATGYGDYEAQRHWMEVTVNVPINEWYVESFNNSLAWWGLDYPPLSAYHAYIFGKLSQIYEPTSVALYTSRGYETQSHKAFMRWSVLISDVLFMFSGAFYYWLYIKASGQKYERIGWILRLSSLATLLSCPIFILIDHGHFQYNCICYGLVIWSICFMAKAQYLVASIAFTLSLLFKQSMLYYAPAYFFMLLGLSVRKLSKTGMKMVVTWDRWVYILFRLLKLALCVLLTVLFVCFPILSAGLYRPLSPKSIIERLLMHLHMESLIPVYRRIFPFHRGLYEDYVSNFWVLISPLIKLKLSSYSLPQSTLFLSTILTLTSLLPSCFNLCMKPTFQRFLYSLFNCSMAFFLFSWQVHEKAISLPLLPLMLMFDDEGFAGLCFTLVASLSLLHLMIKDGIVLNWFVLTLGWLVFAYSALDRRANDTDGVDASSLPHNRRSFALLAQKLSLKCRIMYLNILCNTPLDWSRVVGLEFSTIRMGASFSSTRPPLGSRHSDGSTKRRLVDTRGIDTIAFSNGTDVPPMSGIAEDSPMANPPPTHHNGAAIHTRDRMLRWLYCLSDVVTFLRTPLTFNPPSSACIASTPSPSPQQQSLPLVQQLEKLRREERHLDTLLDISVLWGLFFFGLLVIASILTLLQLVIAPPTHLPYLYVYITSGFCCIYFVLSLMYGTLWQYQLPHFDNIFLPDVVYPIISSSDSIIASDQQRTDTFSLKTE